MRLSDLRMNSWHSVDEYVLSPLHSEAEVTPQDSVSQTGSVKSKLSSTSLKRSLQEAKRKAAVAQYSTSETASSASQKGQRSTRTRITRSNCAKGIRAQTGTSQTRTRTSAKEKRERGGCHFPPKPSRNSSTRTRNIRTIIYRRQAKQSPKHRNRQGQQH